MFPTNYFYTRSSLRKTAFLTTVFTLLLNVFLFAQTTECTADAGSLNGEICIQNQDVTLKATLRRDTVVPEGYQILYVLTKGDNLVINQVSEEASFDIDELEGVYTIHTLVYDTATLDLGDVVLGETEAADVFELLIAGGGNICAALDTAGVRFRFGNCDNDGCDAEAGRLMADEAACFSDSTATLTATVADSAVLPDGYSLLYVLTSGDSLVIEQVNEDPTFTVDTTGRYRIHAFVYDPDVLNLDSLVVVGETTGGEIVVLLTQGGGDVCGALDVEGALFDIEACDENDCNADAGMVTTDDGETTTFTICAGDGESDIINLSNNGADLDSGTYVYFVTNVANEVLEIITDDNTDLEGVGTDSTYRIWGFVYTADSLSVEEGDTLSLTVPIDSCSALSENFITILNNCTEPEPECDATTGRLSGNPISCLAAGDSLTLVGDIQTEATVPDGYEVLYVLTSGDSLVIEQVNGSPEFEVDSVGTYRIHVLVYDSTTLDLGTVVFGETTGADVNALLIQGGGEICGALDVQGVLFNVIECPDNLDSCIVTAGSLIVLDEAVCLDEDEEQVTLQASVQEAPIVLDSFQVVYVLTSTDSLVILAANDEPSFMVDSVGRYRIHTLVYDSTTLSLDSIVLGTTTGFDVNALLIQGGGDICGALDTEGALFEIEICQDTCEATFGALEIDGDDACFSDSTATLSARVSTEPTVPEGYSVIYVLTSGTDLVIEQVNATPTFTVDTTGRYTIHTLVYDSTTLDLSTVEFGETTGADVNALLIQGGGEICAALDVSGLVFNVEPCNADTCEFDLGTLEIADDSDDCLDNGEATIRATVEADAEVPNNYALTYLLTYGLGSDRTIQQINDEPVFTVDTTGRFRILTFVYDSTAYNLDSIRLNETTSSELAELLVQNGGELCAGLDEDGLIFNIRNCNDTTCVVDAGNIRKDNDSDRCLEEGEATLRGIVVQEPEAPENYRTVYLLASGRGNTLVIEQINEEPVFTVDTTGQFRMLTFVYDSTTFDLQTIVLGETTSSALDARLIQEGGDICAALDENSPTFNVDEDCDTGTPFCDATFGSLMIIDRDVRCYEGDTIAVQLKFGNSPDIPRGFEYAILISQGREMTITQVLNSLSFNVDSVSLYRIHTFVYEPASFDLSSINIGSTTAMDINALLAQGGGQICAALDTNGIVLDIRDCEADVDCEEDVNAGSLSTNDSNPCLTGNGSVILAAFTAQEPDVPQIIYEVKYVLTSGTDLVIEQIKDDPSFEVNEAGRYRIHTLVYNPATLNLRTVLLGVTTAGEINEQLLQGGGDICAALDTVGIRFDVGDCTCTAAAGELFYTRASGRSTCLNNNLALLAANTRIRTVVPSGYRRVYVLTSGDDLAIERVAEIPVFSVRDTGTYRIHTLVYDPTTLNLNSIVFGETLAGDVNALLRQGGGTICAALELPGLEYEVENCATGGNPPGITVFPNPATNQLNLNLTPRNDVQRVTIELIDMNGNIAKQWQLDGVSANTSLDISDMQPGMYYVRVLYDQAFTQELSIIKTR